MIQVALSLNDAFSKGLVSVARNAKKQGAEISDGMMKAARNTDAFKKKLNSVIDSSIAKLGKLAVAAGTTAAAFSLKTDMDFESQMAKMQAIAIPDINADGAREEFQSLIDKAREVGRVSKYTATEVAQALEYMGMAGWNAGEMKAALPGVVNLSAATNADLASVSDIVTDQITAFHMGAYGLALTAATATTAGAMSAADKSKLDSIQFATDEEVNAMLDGVFGA